MKAFTLGRNTIRQRSLCLRIKSEKGRTPIRRTAQETTTIIRANQIATAPEAQRAVETHMRTQETGKSRAGVWHGLDVEERQTSQPGWSQGQTWWEGTLGSVQPGKKELGFNPSSATHCKSEAARGKD